MKNVLLRFGKCPIRRENGTCRQGCKWTLGSILFKGCTRKVKQSPTGWPLPAKQLQKRSSWTSSWGPFLQLATVIVNEVPKRLELVRNLYLLASLHYITLADLYWRCFKSKGYCSKLALNSDLLNPDGHHHCFIGGNVSPTESWRHGIMLTLRSHGVDVGCVEHNSPSLDRKLIHLRRQMIISQPRRRNFSPHCTTRDVRR